MISLTDFALFDHFINSITKIICEDKISYQAYSNGMNALNTNHLSNSVYWLKQALEAKNPNVKTLAKYQLDKIARTTIDSVKNNLNYIPLIDIELNSYIPTIYRPLISLKVFFQSVHCVGL